MAVFAGKTARGSESLRMRHVGGWRPRLVGALRPLAGLLDEGATRASGCLAAVRDCSAFYPLLPASRCALAVLLVVAGFWVPRRVIAVNGTSPVWRNQAASLLLWSGSVRL
ncbi:hypothetical protein, partial [Catenulispora rubra]|uniref:hypothetical protein n=1 Tax=Catenulispora rubra TaxID=280293 RepID=UPI001E654EAD